MSDGSLKPLHLYGLGVIVIIVLILYWYQHQYKEVSWAPVAVATSTQSAVSVLNEEGQQYAKVSQNCALYYENVGIGKDLFSKELSDFTNLHPLADFLCDKYSDVMEITLSDGKTLYFVAPISSLGCGSGGCTYYPFLEEKKGLVRHLRGFTGQETDGTVFGFLSIDLVRHSVSVYWHESAQCGTTNIFTFNSKDEPVLFSSSDSCTP